MILNFRQRDHQSKQKDKIISQKQGQLTRKMNEDINAFRKLNEVLDNGITLEIKKAIGGHNV